MGRLTHFRDSLYNMITGLGTMKDPTTASQFVFRLLSREELENTYRSDWVAKKVVDAPAEDATREWRAWQAGQNQIEQIEEEEKRHLLQKKMREAIIRGRLYGGAALLFAINNQDPQTELDVDSVRKGDLEFVVVMNRYELMAGPRIFNVASKYYTRPEYYTVATPVFGLLGEAGTQFPVGGATQNVTQPVIGAGVMVHPSRVIEFVGHEIPDWRLIPMGGMWGDSVLQTVDELLRDMGLVVGGIANMINDAKVDVIHIPNFAGQIATKEYAANLLRRFSYANQAKSAVNSLLLDTTETWERVQTQFGGLPNILHEYMMLAGGACDIPMSRLIGQSSGRGLGEGATSTGGQGAGDADLRNYYDRIASKQKTTYKPALEQLDQVLVRSATGNYDKSIHYTWNPLWQQDEQTKAQTQQTKAAVVKADVEMGLINEDVLRQARVNQLVEDGFYPGIEEAIDEFGAEPEEPDIQVPWSRLAGAMAALGGPQPGGAPGKPNGKAAGGGTQPSPLPPKPGVPELMSKMGVQARLPNMRVTGDAAEKVSKVSVNYREGTQSRQCGNCAMFMKRSNDSAIGTCSLVKGVIATDDVCDKWEAIW